MPPWCVAFVVAWGCFMDISTGLGLAAGGVVLCALIMMGGDLRMFADLHAAIVIFGGSFAATLIRFPLPSRCSPTIPTWRPTAGLPSR